MPTIFPKKEQNCPGCWTTEGFYAGNEHLLSKIKKKTQGSVCPKACPIVLKDVPKRCFWEFLPISYRLVWRAVYNTYIRRNFVGKIVVFKLVLLHLTCMYSRTHITYLLPRLATHLYQQHMYFKCCYDFPWMKKKIMQLNEN